MTLDERVEQFKRTFPRPTSWDSAWDVVLRLTWDLADERPPVRDSQHIKTFTDLDRLRRQVMGAQEVELCAQEMEDLRARVGILSVACTAAMQILEDQ